MSAVSLIGARVQLSNTFSGAATVTGVSNANPAVVTSAAHGFANGDAVVLRIDGIDKLAEQIIRIKNVSANTFEIDDATGSIGDTSDASASGVFVSGSCQRVTAWLSVSDATTFTIGAATQERIDTTPLSSKISTNIPGRVTPGDFQAQGHYDLTQNAVTRAIRASINDEKVAIRVIAPNGTTMLIYGYIGGAEAAQTDNNLLKFQWNISQLGRVANYPPAVVASGPRPKFGVFAAGPTATNTNKQAILAALADYGTAGTDNGSFLLVTTAGNYGWMAVPDSQVDAGGVTFTSASAPGFPGGWDGAGLAGNVNVGSPPAVGTYITVTDPGSVVWRLYRQDFANANASPGETWTTA